MNHTSLHCMIFDLDGTLLDSGEGILECVTYAIEKLGYHSLSDEVLRTFIGPPLRASFMRHLGCSPEEAERLTTAYREHYREEALLHAKPYDGIFELCESMLESGVLLAVATSKPQEFTDRILTHFGLDRFFASVRGDDLAGNLKKPDLIRYCLSDLGFSPEHCVMVGDSEHDGRGAKDTGTPFIAVSYGFGNMDEIRKCPHLGIAESPAEVRTIAQRAFDF